MCTLSLLAQSIVSIANHLSVGGSCKKSPTTPPPVVDKCKNLKEGKQYYLKTADGRFVVRDSAKQLGFVKSVASKFTATQVGCNLYGLCVDGFCMSRCDGCKSDTNEGQTVKFHLKNSNEPYSRWTFVPAGSAGVYNLKIDGSFGYLNYKKTSAGDYQVSLSTALSDENKFHFIEAK